MLETKQHLQFTGNRTGRVLAIILPIVVMIPATVIFCYYLWRKKRKLAGTLLLIGK